MEFALTADQDAFREKMSLFAAKSLAPFYQSDDKTGQMTPSILDDMRELGLFGLRIPTEHGGQAADAVTVGVAIEEIARANINAAYLLLSACLVGEIITNNCTDDRRDPWLRAIANGRLSTLALTEPDHGSDAANISLRADPVGDGWVLTGQKSSVCLVDHAEKLVVFARTGGPGARGITAFYVDMDDSRLSRTRSTDFGNRAIGRSDLYFDGLEVSRDDMIGAEGEGFVSVMSGFDYTRAFIGLATLATASAALEDAFDYARTRQTFGVPLGSHQGVAFPLVESATELAAARLMCYEALWAKDVGRDYAVRANMVKWWAPKISVEAVHRVLLTFGSAAWSEESPQGQRLRDCMGFQIADGTAQMVKLVVARAMLGRQYAP